MTSSGTVTVGLKLLYEREGEKISFPIEEGETFIGRKDYCDICFPDGSVSKRHVRIVRTGSKVELFDAGHMGIEYRYPLSLRYLAERLSPSG